ncbi:hypothetical protein [Nostoc sp.]|uniref:hypothetical protein n=1 Tax=Nostoc sp. TaxID=1180 RepID=UPI002FFB24B5
MSVTDNNIDVYTPVTDTTTKAILQKLQKVVKTGATQGWKRLGVGDCLLVVSLDLKLFSY